jgi:putative drug exporter of the RND superfamily
VLHRVTLLAIAAPRRVLGLAALVMAAAAVFGVPVANSLSAGGFQDPIAESSRATGLLTDKFGRGEVQLLLMVTAPDGVGGDAARAAGLDIVNQIQDQPYVINVTSAWTAPPQAAADLVSRDGRSGLVVAGIAGGEKEAPARAKALSQSVLSRHRDVAVLPGGSGMVFSEINSQTARDVLAMESIAFPVSFVVLVWVFGGLLAAALPVVVGGLAILGALSILRFIATTTDVSIFALSLSTALGLALAIDYTLLIVTRYRDEISDGAQRDQALIRTMRTAGRTVLFSATTVTLSMATMVLFPMYFLKSFAYAGIATVAACTVAALVVTPAAIVLLGTRLDAFDVRRGIRRMLHRDQPSPKPTEQLFWYRWAKSVMRRAVVIGLAGSTVLIVLGLPFLGIKWGFPDDRVLPSSSSAHQVGDRMREGFTDNSATAVTIVVPDAEGLTPADFERYAAQLSRVADVTAVSAPTAAFTGGNQIGPPVAPAGLSGGSAFLTVGTNVPLFSSASDTQLDRLHEVAAPGDRAVEFTGLAQINRDGVDAITSRLPVVLTVIAVVTFALLFLLTGSVVLPVKALVLNVLSLTAAFGALVWIFQEGHLGALGTTPTDTLVVNIPVLLFCIAFGLSMDYEVFLISRIREFWLACGAAVPKTSTTSTTSTCDRTGADNDESVALGLAHTGRVITAAALVMVISFAALIAAHVSFMRMFGVGLTLAVLVDATLVRMVLVPAFMHILGRWNWWAPAPIARLHTHIRVSESGSRRRKRPAHRRGKTFSHLLPTQPRGGSE